MNKMVQVKSILLFVCVFGSVPLLAMEIESYKKSKDHCWVKGALFFAKQKQEDHVIPKDIANIIVQKSCLLRINEIYKKFDPFFHFNNENYHTMSSAYHKKINLFLDENPDLDGDNDDVVKRFHELYPYNINLCRKFDSIEPHDLLFFTKKQDKILVLLLASPTCFHHDLGCCVIHFTTKEQESYLMLSPEFIEKLDNEYPIFLRLSIDCDMDMSF